jgi:hypothetical protein
LALDASFTRKEAARNADVRPSHRYGEVIVESSADSVAANSYLCSWVSASRQQYPVDCSALYVVTDGENFEVAICLGNRWSRELREIEPERITHWMRLQAWAKDLWTGGSDDLDSRWHLQKADCHRTDDEVSPSA